MKLRRGDRFTRMSATVDDLELPPAVFATCPWQPREPIETGFAAMAALLCTRAVGQPGGRRAVARRRRTAARPDSLHGAVCGVLQQGLRSTSPPPSQGRRTRGPARGRRLGRIATPEDGRRRGARREPWREVRPVGSGYTGRCGWAVVSIRPVWSRSRMQSPRPRARRRVSPC